jgi:hypothetical protein
VIYLNISTAQIVYSRRDRDVEGDVRGIAYIAALTVLIEFVPVVLLDNWKITVSQPNNTSYSRLHVSA